MTSQREIALQILPHFARHVLAKRQHTYGYYSKVIGRPPTESILVGGAMHAIGVACVFARVPVAPLVYVERADRGWRGIFESDVLERKLVLPHYELLFIVARKYDYTERDFERVDYVLREIIPTVFPAGMLSPHQMWHVALDSTGTGDTFFGLAIESYKNLLAKWKSGSRHAAPSS